MLTANLDRAVVVVVVVVVAAAKEVVKERGGSCGVQSAECEKWNVAECGGGRTVECGGRSVAEGGTHRGGLGRRRVEAVPVALG